RQWDGGKRSAEEMRVGENDIGKPRLPPGGAGDGETDHGRHTCDPATRAGAIRNLRRKGDRGEKSPQEPCEGVRLHTTMVHAPQVWDIAHKTENDGCQAEEL